MSFFNHLWDETLAGPRPDPGQIRRFSSSNSASISGGFEPSSPASCHDSPLTPTSPGKDWRRKKAEPRNPTVFDWVMIGSLDR